MTYIFFRVQDSRHGWTLGAVHRSEIERSESRVNVFLTSDTSRPYVFNAQCNAEAHYEKNDQIRLVGQPDSIDPYFDESASDELWQLCTEADFWQLSEGVIVEFDFPLV